MNFLSDNAYGAAPEIIRAIVAANESAVSPYGGDPYTARLPERMAEVFEREVAVFPVATGTAANALALSTLCPRHGAILCHAEAHILADECGATEFFSNGARLVAIEGAHGKITPASIELALKRFIKGDVHHSQPAVVTLTQSTECGTVYSLAEIAAVAAVAKKHGLKLHLDGARIANALASLGATPADATWRLGVDALSFGATKNGGLGADAVIFFNPEDVHDFEFRRMKAGHLFSKMRFVSAQLMAYVEHDLWLKNAAQANKLAKRLAEGLSAISNLEIIHSVESSAIFVRTPDALAAKLRKAGAQFLDWAPSENGRVLARLVLSYATPEADVERFLEVAKS
jgi:threonine aldolase